MDPPPCYLTSTLSVRRFTNSSCPALRSFIVPRTRVHCPGPGGAGKFEGGRPGEKFTGPVVVRLIDGLPEQK